MEGAWSNIYESVTPSFWTSANQVGPVSGETRPASPHCHGFRGHTSLKPNDSVWISLRNSGHLVGSRRSCEWERILVNISVCHCPSLQALSLFRHRFSFYLASREFLDFGTNVTEPFGHTRKFVRSNHLIALAQCLRESTKFLF